MVFSSIIFLFFFLPVVLSIYHLLFLPVSLKHKQAVVWRRMANLFLLCTSLLFYFWGEQWLTWIIIASTFIDYFCGLLISGALHKGRIEIMEEGEPRTILQKTGLFISLISNLAFLGFFKYFNFGIDTYNAIVPEALRATDVMKIALPLGISFYTFQSMSYTIDVYRGHVKATRNIIDFACFVTLFPQLVAGPIVRYCDVAHQMVHREMNIRLFSSGVTRFVLGLGKKVLIANTVARAADMIFALPPDKLTTSLSWVAVVCYTLQIYYDFSGYSDMAIGLGRMFGFEFLENFNYPYIARSIQDFWRRWHISLSTWFRDYLYIPLGGSRKSSGRTYLNLVIIFFVCGLWHGANWAYVAWGLFQGAFLVIERGGLAKLLERIPRVLQHAYALIVVMVGWSLFATESFPQSFALIKSMFGFAPAHVSPIEANEYFAPDLRLAIAYGILFATPLLPWMKSFALGFKDRVVAFDQVYGLIKTTTLTLVFLFSAMALASGTHNPFIYFRF